MNIILNCGHAPTPSEVSPGHGIWTNEKTGEQEKHCFSCCAIMDDKQMRETGMATLYLVDNELINWPGTLRFRVLNTSVGRHNFGIKRYDVWFYGPDKKIWHGVRYGDNTQLARCKRTKHKA